MYPPLFSLNNQVDVPSTWTDPQEMYPLLFSVTTTQVDVPSTCTTKDVPSNVLRQSSQAVSPLKLCEWGNKRILRRLVLWNLLFMGKGRIKRILRLCRFEFFDKGEGRHKRIQAVSPLFFWKREKRDTKRIQAVSPWQILFGKGRREWKRWITQVFEQRTFLGRESFEQKLLERWREDEIRKF